MASETTVSTINRFSSTFILVGIIALGLIGLINLFTDHVAQGFGFVSTSLILLRVFVWLEKEKLHNAKVQNTRERVKGADRLV